MIEFTVHGEPVPQGSKNQWGGEANPRTRPWRAAVSAAAHDAMTVSSDHADIAIDSQRELLTDAVQVKVEFVFTRPKSHYGTGKNAGILKGGAPEYVSRSPDVDKLARAILDGLSGIVFRDDAQVAHLNVWKRYGPSAYARIQVAPLATRSLIQVSDAA